MLPREYVREALKRGLQYEAKFGVNPFKFGMVGSTDSYTSLAITREDNVFGKATPAEPGGGAERYMEKITGVVPSQDGSDVAIRHYQALASGLAAVWSKDNTLRSNLGRREAQGGLCDDRNADDRAGLRRLGF